MTHEDAWEKLAALAAGTLPEPERRLVEEHSAGCSACREELAAWTKLREAELELSEQAPPLPPYLLTRSLARIDEESPGTTPWWTRLGFWKTAAAVQLALLLLLGGYAWKKGAGPGYEVLGEQGAARRGESLLDVRFNPAAKDQEIRAVLNELHARIVDGPSAFGVYTIAVRDREAAGAIAALRARKPVVEFAELHP